MTDPEKRTLVCFSGGKDSTAMLLRMLEIGEPVHGIAFADTLREFPELYEYIEFIQGYLDEHYPQLRKDGIVIEMLQPVHDFDEWMNGKAERGRHEGKVRGLPLHTFPCWYARNAKLRPLENHKRDGKFDVSCVGIAIDESHRTSLVDPGLRYPLCEWGWTEPDCIKYLEDKGIPNPLYKVFARLGCFHCHKQGLASWWGVWKNYPDLWQQSVALDEAGAAIDGRRLRSDSEPLTDLAKRFEGGFVPEGKYEGDCQTCKAVAFNAVGLVGMDEFFEIDDTIEKDFMIRAARIAQYKREGEIKRGHLENRHDGLKLNQTKKTMDSMFDCTTDEGEGEP